MKGTHDPLLNIFFLISLSRQNDGIHVVKIIKGFFFYLWGTCLVAKLSNDNKLEFVMLLFFFFSCSFCVTFFFCYIWSNQT